MLQDEEHVPLIKTKQLTCLQRCKCVCRCSVDLQIIKLFEKSILFQL